MSPFSSLCPWLSEALLRLEQAAADGRLGHAWLMSGARGVGKTHLAYVFVERLLAGRHRAPLPEPARASALVGAYAQHAAGFDLHPDLYRVFANDERFKRDKDKEKRTISVEQIRATTADLSLKPHIAGLKAVIIERAETMTNEAANALLKTLEEPTPDTYLLLLADRPGRLPATIRSRCQHLPLSQPAAAPTRAWLAEDGLAVERLPARALLKPPLVLAEMLCDPELINSYNNLSDGIDVLLEGKGDPHRLADDWHGEQAEFALSCLIENLQLAIRARLVPGHSNPITDSGAGLPDNMSPRLPTRTLFAGLKMAENLREQLGRGTNVELGLKALLLELDTPADRGVHL